MKFKIIDWYIIRQVVVSSLFILVLLLMLRSLFSLIDELADIEAGRYQIADALLFIGLMLPARLLEFFPMSVLIGALFSLGNLAANSELTAMRAAGITTWKIAASAIKGSIILMIAAIIIGEWIAPIATKSAQQLKTSAISEGEVSVSSSGIWAKHENQIIHIGQVDAKGQISDVMIFEMNEGYQLQRIIQAQQANRQENNWLLKEVVETRFFAKHIETRQITSTVWEKPLKRKQLETLVVEPESLNFVGLIRYIDYLSRNKMQTEAFELAAWGKLMQPLALAVMMFLAASFVFGPMRNVSMGARILGGVMVGFGFHLTNQTFGPASLVFNLPPLFGAVSPLLIFALVGFYLMKRNH
ncbi:LPS export ABC transporter permease LptG [Aliikangiella maris]|uniref:LPS export ABC transporter permease LptG n=2 Tax=Aliikangiella maris TaxID=3162458 RepID=A0ABV2BNK2_9GAMM